MKKLVLNDRHVDLGGKMVSFAGYSMPVQYKGVNAEHHAVRDNVGIFDVSHMGEFAITGPKALDLIQYATSNDASELKDGGIQYSCFPNDSNGIVDDLLVYRFAEDKYMLVVNASNLEKDWNWITKLNEKIGADISNKSDEYSLFAIQGPNATKVLQPLTKHNLADIKYYNFELGEFAGISNVIISATGYTGSGGFEIYVRNEDAIAVWDAIMESGAAVNIEAIGLAARDTLRLEMGYCLYGNDINDTTSPMEAGLSWITKFSKDFVNKDYLEQEKSTGASRKLIGFELIERGIPRKDYTIVDETGSKIGVVTSGTMSPTLKKAIGMGYVNASNTTTGSTIFIEVRNKKIRAKIVSFPFK